MKVCMKERDVEHIVRQKAEANVDRRWTAFCVMVGYSLLLIQPVYTWAAQQAEVAYAQGIIAYDDRDYPSALEHFRRAVALAPENPHAQLYLGLSLNRTGEFQAAIQALKTALQLDPGLHRAHHPLGLAYFREKQYRSAVAQFDRALQFAPNRAATLFYLGYTHYLLNNYRQTLPLLQRASELNPTLILRAQYYRGVALYALERDAEARPAFETAISAAPETATARSAQRYLDAIEKRSWTQQRLQLQGTVSFQYDDNVILEPNEIEISRQDDGRTVFVLTGRFLPLNWSPWRLGAEYTLYQSLHFDLHEFDIQSHTARLFSRWKSGRITLRTAADYTFTLLDNRHFSSLVTLGASATIWQTKQLFATVSLRYRFSDYVNQFIPPQLEPDDAEPPEPGWPIRTGREVRDRDGQSIRAGFDQYIAFNRNRAYARLS